MILFTGFSIEVAASVRASAARVKNKSSFRMITIVIFIIISITADPYTVYSYEVPPQIGFIDGHADTITTAMGAGQGMRVNDLHIDFERLAEYGAPIQVFTVWCDDGHLGNAFEYADTAIDFFMGQLDAHSDMIGLALTFEDIEQNIRDNRISAILALEGAEPLEGKINNLEYFYNRGVRVITLTWNRENELGYGVGTGSDKGLKPFGLECVRLMNELGIIIDVSHLNTAGFRDVVEISDAPFIASHSNAYGVAGHRRNLADWQIEEMVKRGCIIGLNMYPYFLTGSNKAGADDVLKHIEYFAKLGAADIIGLGCDFDGIEIVPEGFDGVESLTDLKGMIAERFGAETADAIYYKNFYQFLSRFFEPILK